MQASSQPSDSGARPQPTGYLPAFDFQPRTRVVFGAGRLKQLGELCLEAGGQRIFLVTDAGLEKAGHVQRAIQSLEASGLTVVLFDEVHPNPTTDDVDRGLAFARDGRVDLIVGLGGGSSMDCAKGVNFLLTNGGKMEDYWGVGKAKLPMLPLIAVPTTAGTGSEAQSFALIAQAKTHMKMACGDPKAACRVALLDPELTVSMPGSVTSATGIDAISHAVESFVTTRRNPISQLFSRQAWQLLSAGLPAVLDDADDLEGRSKMQLGSHLGGAAIENSMLGATHALANPLTAHFDITHGVAIGIMLPHVIRYNARVVSPLYRLLAEDAGLCEATDPDPARCLAEFLTDLVRQADQPVRLSECNVTADDLPRMAEEAAKQWTGTFNPRPVDAASLRELYRCAL